MMVNSKTENVEASRDDGKDDEQVPPDYINKKALFMMEKMGYQSGIGLGKKQEGILTPVQISSNVGTRGFGLNLENLTLSDEIWEGNQEDINVEETANWLENANKQTFNLDSMLKWIKRSSSKSTIEDESNFCNSDVLGELLLAKEILNGLDPVELCRARSRANPYESVKNAIFMNRAAVKIANIDAATNFMLSEIDHNPVHTKSKGPYYFADVCAGPGGFSEYMLWRKKWLFKGFGFTLRGDHDFNLFESTCASPVTFSSMYGVLNDGDICCPDNIRDFAERVRRESEGKGVHFMMSDGGFSVDGKENLQEILSKQLYVCQCLMALEIVRPHGHFVTKVFDLFTVFSAGLLYLMHQCFRKMAIIKPNSSRPANSERYLVFADLQTNSHVAEVRKYLWHIVGELFQLRQIEMETSVDINEIVPLPVIKIDQIFTDYITESNNKIATAQVVALSKLVVFCHNPQLVEPRQVELRQKCLEYLKIPDEIQLISEICTVDYVLYIAVHNPDFLLCQPQQITEISDFMDDAEFQSEEWRFSLCQSNKKRKYCTFYVAVTDSRVYRLQNKKWERVRNLHLIRGTFLYGEMVQENIKLSGFFHNNKHTFKRSLHVIDAIRLGDISLADISFSERIDLIETYCQAVNHDSRKSYIRIRSKLTPVLDTLFVTPQSTTIDLPLIGYNSMTETYNCNSLLLHRDNQDFGAMHQLRMQVYLNYDSSRNGISLQLLIDYITSKRSNSL